jgi:acyl carrier protein
MQPKTASVRQQILPQVIAILKDIMVDWETDISGEIGPGTRLVEDLYFTSLDVVQLVVAIEKHFDRRDLPFERLLMTGGRYIDDLTVDELVSFLESNL